MNDQSPKRVDRDEDGFVNVHSIFKTIQGEGPFTGQRAVFVRLFGCNLQCPFCDTDYTSKRVQLSPQEVLESVDMGLERQSDRDLVVITGGEPFRQNINEVVRKLVAGGFRVQIETNGTLDPGDGFPWDDEHVTVVCSPKTGKIHPVVAEKAHAYKYVLSHDNVAPDGLPKSALGHPLGGMATVARPPVGWTGPVYLNPMDDHGAGAYRLNVQAVIESTMEHSGITMGLQLHKELGLP